MSQPSSTSSESRGYSSAFSGSRSSSAFTGRPVFHDEASAEDFYCTTVRQEEEEAPEDDFKDNGVIPFDFTTLPKRPMRVFQPDIIPVGGATVTIEMRTGEFVTGTGLRMKASDQALKLRAEWLEGARKMEQQRNARSRNKHTGRPLFVKEDAERVPERFMPAELPDDFEELLALGNNTETGPHVDDFMEQTVKVDYLDTLEVAVPPPVNCVADMDLPSQLVRNLDRMGITDFLPVQRHVISIAMAGYDVIGCAPTGTGKTAAFLIPIIRALFVHQLRATLEADLSVLIQKPRALILVPTRELAMQMHTTTSQIAFGTGITTFALYGALDQELIRARIECDILIATPGRMMEVIQRQLLKLSGLLFVVVDEADRMFGKSFPEVQKVLEDASLPSMDRRQTMFFSATVPYHQIPVLRRHQNRAFSVKIGSDGPVSSVAQRFEKTIGHGEKMVCLRKALDEAANENRSTLIFGGPITMVERLTSELKYLNIVTIHGKMSQQDRAESLRKFVDKECSVLLATDIASRGLDIAEVGMIVNFCLPRTVDDYIHRVGRTARKGHDGRALTFVDPNFRRDGRVIVPLVAMLRECKVNLPNWLLDEAERRAVNYTVNDDEVDPPSDAEDLADLGIFPNAKHDTTMYGEWPL